MRRTDSLEKMKRPRCTSPWHKVLGEGKPTEVTETATVVTCVGGWGGGHGCVGGGSLQGWRETPLSLLEWRSHGCAHLSEPTASAPSRASELHLGERDLCHKRDTENSVWEKPFSSPHLVPTPPTPAEWARELALCAGRARPGGDGCGDQRGPSARREKTQGGSPRTRGASTLSPRCPSTPPSSLGMLVVMLSIFQQTF